MVDIILPNAIRPLKRVKNNLIFICPICDKRNNHHAKTAYAYDQEKKVLTFVCNGKGCHRKIPVSLHEAASILI